MVKGKIDICAIGWASRVASKTDLEAEHGGHEAGGQASLRQTEDRRFQLVSVTRKVLERCRVNDARMDERESTLNRVEKRGTLPLQVRTYFGSL